MQTVLSARPPFSLTAVVRSHGWIQLAPFVEDDPVGGFSCVMELESGRVVAVRVGEAPGGV